MRNWIIKVKIERNKGFPIHLFFSLLKAHPSLGVDIPLPCLIPHMLNNDNTDLVSRRVVRWRDKLPCVS